MVYNDVIGELDGDMFRLYNSNYQAGVKTGIIIFFIPTCIKWNIRASLALQFCARKLYLVYTVDIHHNKPSVSAAAIHTTHN
jgi:hypothetical protein